MLEGLLPQPKELIPGQAECRLGAAGSITLPACAGEASFVAARQLQAEATSAAGLRLPIRKVQAAPTNSPSILLVCGPEEAAFWGLEVPPLDIAEDMALPGRIEAQAFAISIDPVQILLYGGAAPGLYYAVQTLRQLLRLQGDRLPALTLRDWPTLANRGLMLDVSRRKVPTLETLKHLVVELAHYKLNVLQLYTEHTFHFPSHPKIGTGCGSLTSEDMIELDLFCRQHHVELIPNLQSFGHAREILQLPEYQHLAETDLCWTLSPAYEGTYALLDDLYGDMLPAFSSTTLNVNCDETYDLGTGASKGLADEIGSARLFLNHILRVRDLAAKYGRRIQVWGDVLLSHPELVEELPEDVTLLDWHYYPANEYPSVQTFGRSGRRFWVCPGVGSWNSIFPRLSEANVNIRNLVRDGVAAGAEGMLNTDWGDFGHYQYMGLSWHGYVYGAVQGWTGGETDVSAFDAAFGPLFFGPGQEAIMEALHRLGQINDLPGVLVSGRCHTVLALFEDPLAGETVYGDDALATDTLDQMLTLAGVAATTCDGLAAGHLRRRTLLEMTSAARLTAFAARKTQLGQGIRAALAEVAAQPAAQLEPGQASAARLYALSLELRALDREVETLRVEFEDLWLARARRSEMDVALGYFGALRVRMAAAQDWLMGQHRAILAGEAVDGSLSTYDAGDHRILWKRWPDM